MRRITSATLAVAPVLRQGALTRKDLDGRPLRGPKLPGELVDAAAQLVAGEEEAVVPRRGIVRPVGRVLDRPVQDLPGVGPVGTVLCRGIADGDDGVEGHVREL